VGAVAPEADHCPHCDAGVAPGQEYCLECGARLPHPHGVMPALAGAWRARLRWYPGDWIWAALVLLIVAAAGAAVAVASTGTTPARTELFVATGAKPVPVTPTREVTSTPTPAQQQRNEKRTHTPPKKQTTLVTWPFGRTAYTVVLSSYPSATASLKANRLARRAMSSGLTDVGILDSSRYSSLHPGYLVIFTGVYESADDAASAQQHAQRLGFGKAYTRQIVS
jgi:hypothetical protein